VRQRPLFLWVQVLLAGLPLVMGGDYGDFSDKSFHSKSLRISGGVSCVVRT
jgi:hypothetical protein